jgi:hypothetical protein
MLLNRGVEAALKVVGGTLSTRQMQVTFKRCLGECPPTRKLRGIAPPLFEMPFRRRFTEF